MIKNQRDEIILIPKSMSLRRTIITDPKILEDLINLVVKLEVLMEELELKNKKLEDSINGYLNPK